MILEFQINLIKSIHDKNIPVDGIAIGDDWGTEQSLFISPSLWRKLFKGRYKKIIDLCHKYNYHVWLHIDGKINEIFDDFIEIGLDAINLMSPELLGVEKIGKRYKGKITFFCSIDHQRTLAYGTMKEIRNELEKVIKCFGSRKGGLVLYFCDGNAKALGIDINRITKIIQVIKEFKDFYNC